MPFTLSHAAAALPFRRARLVPSALVIGTFAPDLEYFIRLDPGGGWGHTIAGAFGMDLPLGLACLWLFHRLVKAPLAYLVPDSIRSRLTEQLAPFPFRPLRRFVHICASMLLGVATHIFWDGFTHTHYWGVRHLPFLRGVVREPLLGWSTVAGVLQDLSTVLGFLVLAVFCYWWLRRSTPDESIPRNPYSPVHRAVIACTGAIVANAGAVLRAWLGVGIPKTRYELDDFICQFVVTVGALVWWQLAVWGLLGPFRHLRGIGAEEEAYARSRTTANR